LSTGGGLPCFLTFESEGENTSVPISFLRFSRDWRKEGFSLLFPQAVARVSSIPPTDSSRPRRTPNSDRAQEVPPKERATNPTNTLRAHAVRFLYPEHSFERFQLPRGLSPPPQSFRAFFGGPLSLVPPVFGEIPIPHFLPPPPPFLFHNQETPELPGYS